MRGCSFAVWAPNARRVSVVGDFNGWDGRVYPMRKLISGGVWEIFLPGVGEGAHYKFEVLGAHGGVQLKSDPFAFYNQHGMQTSSHGVGPGPLRLERRGMDGQTPRHGLAEEPP